MLLGVCSIGLACASFYMATGAAANNIGSPAYLLQEQVDAMHHALYDFPTFQQAGLLAKRLPNGLTIKQRVRQRASSPMRHMDDWWWSNKPLGIAGSNTLKDRIERLRYLVAATGRKDD